MKAKKLILAGDPKQLPPTVLSVPKKQKAKAKTKTQEGSSTSHKKSPPAQDTSLTKGIEELGLSESDSDTDADPPESQAEDPVFTETADVDDTEPPMEDEDQKDRKPEKGKKVGESKLVPLRPPRSLETTLFDRLLAMHGPRVKRMLNVQYRYVIVVAHFTVNFIACHRMHKRIVTFPSRKMYDSKLRSHPSVSNRLLRDLPNIDVGEEEDEDGILSIPVVFFDTAGCEYFERADGDSDEGSKCNENEATVVKNWVEKLVCTGGIAWRIAHFLIRIVRRLAQACSLRKSQFFLREFECAYHLIFLSNQWRTHRYQAQVTLLTSLLRPLYGAEIEIGTVDSMQGREKDAVIISLVRSNDSVGSRDRRTSFGTLKLILLQRSVGFLKDKRRLNG